MVSIALSKQPDPYPSAYVRMASSVGSSSGESKAPDRLYPRALVDESIAIGSTSDITVNPNREVRDIAGTFMVVHNGDRPRGGVLKVLPRPDRLAVEYGPHLVRRTIDGLLSSFESFRDSVGNPAAATKAAEVRLSLANAYRSVALRPETRNFATTISMLQDMLRPHWSQIPIDKIDAVTAELRAFSSVQKITPSLIARFHKHVSAGLGSQISLDICEEEDDAAGEVQGL